MSFAASLLDELMGRNRNLNPSDQGNELNWQDADVSFVDGRKVVHFDFLITIQKSFKLIVTQSWI